MTDLDENQEIRTIKSGAKKPPIEILIPFDKIGHSENLSLFQIMDHELKL
jgi:hypothetical protein